MEYLLSYHKDEKMVKAILEFIQDFKLAKNMQPYIITKKKALEVGMAEYLVDNYVIVYDDDYYKTFSTTIDQMRQAANDFSRGWMAAQK